MRKKVSGARDSASPRIVLSRIRELRGLAPEGDGGDFDLAIPSLEDLLGHTRRQLLECARCAGLTGFHRLAKAALATRVREEIERLAVLAGPPEPADAPRKFDLGVTSVEADKPEDIPWGYGQDRVTAMALDPERLYVYWEVTDEALDRARTALGPSGRNAWLNLRVYDVTNRIFDGTNAHHHLDHAVSRTDRQWFFSIGRPSSAVVVEVGLQSEEGDFVRVARSGRTEFPRREPAPPGRVEWLTVLSASGEVGEPAPDNRKAPAVIFGGAGASDQLEPARVWDIRRTHGGEAGEWVIRAERVGAREARDEWVRERTIEWEGPIIRTTWEAGPFSYPVEPVRYIEERDEGPVTVRSVDGRSHIVRSPWRVVIRGLGARAERRILAVWEVHRSWIADAGVAVRTVGGAPAAPGVASTLGGSEQAILGASELHWRAASEVRLGGASEVHLIGASELRYLGASETLHAGVSEWRERGASELSYLGASEWRERGASELRYVGASERLYPGASERTWPGASENRARYPAEPAPRE